MALQPHSPEPEQTGILAFIKLCGREKKKKKKVPGLGIVPKGSQDQT